MRYILTILCAFFLLSASAQVGIFDNITEPVPSDPTKEKVVTPPAVEADTPSTPSSNFDLFNIGEPPKEEPIKPTIETPADMPDSDTPITPGIFDIQTIVTDTQAKDTPRIRDIFSIKPDPEVLPNPEGYERPIPPEMIRPSEIVEKPVDSTLPPPNLDLEVKIAARRSMIPGYGLIYAKRWYKAPVYWGVIGAGIASTVYHTDQLRPYANTIWAITDGDTSTNGDLPNLSLEELYDNYKRLKPIRDWSIVGASWAYTLNILDAVQATQSQRYPGRHLPVRAAYYSAMFPGLGQIYNKKYWKLPIVYGALGASIYFVITNQQEYHRLQYARLVRNDGNDLTFDEFEGILSDAGIEEFEEYYRTNLENSFLALGAVYLLNIIDALVDAHLHDFDVSNDLGFRISPTFNPSYEPGKTNFGLAMNFKLNQ